ncbi:hypothetical protein DUI87_06553 [Hirundo rustica rustica]|uniref:Uncharacterized protein n=1 Tax=Hirundo rustica rustica TaxID=333673 RepID=A0A3M0KUK3_HIRRU|nr:hypothetical protein DUI87_06553 [Hirundo rustica rustica]
MSQILCEWLNRDVKLSRRIETGKGDAGNAVPQKGTWGSWSMWYGGVPSTRRLRLLLLYFKECKEVEVEYKQNKKLRASQCMSDDF